MDKQNAAEARIAEKAAVKRAELERFLRRFTTEAIESEAQKKALKAAGWISWGYGMWALTEAGQAEAKRLGFI